MNDASPDIDKVPAYVEQEKKLDWLLWCLFGLTVISQFGSKSGTWLRLPAIIVTIIGLIWVLLIMRWRVTTLTFPKLVYRRLTQGDCFRLFVVLWLGYGKIASLSPVAFILISLFAVPLLFIVVAIGLTEVIVEKSITVPVVCSMLFAYGLFVWQKKALVTHYGVPIIGHFLEKPNYDALYYVKAKPDGSDRGFTLLADIRVESYSETEETGGQNRFGQDETYTFEVKDIWIRRLQMPNGLWVKMADHSGPITPDEGGYVTDQEGRGWHVELTDQKKN